MLLDTTNMLAPSSLIPAAQINLPWGTIFAQDLSLHLYFSKIKLSYLPQTQDLFPMEFHILHLLTSQENL